MHWHILFPLPIWYCFRTQHLFNKHWIRILHLKLCHTSFTWFSNKYLFVPGQHIRSLTFFLCQNSLSFLVYLRYHMLPDPLWYFVPLQYHVPAAAHYPIQTGIGLQNFRKHGPNSYSLICCWASALSVRFLPSSALSKQSLCCFTWFRKYDPGENPAFCLKVWKTFIFSSHPQAQVASLLQTALTNDR